MARTVARKGPGPRGWVLLEGASIAALIAGGILLRVFRLGAEPLWLDEAASFSLARLPLSAIWAWAPAADPANPPLYYALLHFWLRLGESEAALRLLSVLFGVLTVPVVYGLGRTVGSRASGFLSALLFATSPLHVWYAQDARQYALVSLGAGIAILGTALVLRAAGTSISEAAPARRSDDGNVGVRPLAPFGLSAYVVGTGVALLAHTSAVTLLIAANAFILGWFLFDHRSRSRLLIWWLLAQGAVVVIWSTWLPALPGQLMDVSGRFWIPSLDLKEAVFTAHELYAHKTLAGPLPGNSAPLILGFGLLVGGVAVLGAWNCRRDWRLPFTLTFLLVPPAALLIAGWMWRPLLIGRTLIWITIPLYMLLGLGLVALLRRKAVFALALVGLLGMHALGLRNHFHLPEKEAWNEAARYVEEQVRPGDAIFFTANVVDAPFNYYYDGPLVPQHGIPVDRDPTRWEEVPVTVEDVGVIRELALRYRRVWLVYSHEWFDDRQRLVQATLDDAGDLEARRVFRDITIFRFLLREGGSK